MAEAAASLSLSVLQDPDFSSIDRPSLFEFTYYNRGRRIDGREEGTKKEQRREEQNNKLTKQEISNSPYLMCPGSVLERVYVVYVDGDVVLVDESE